MISNKKECVAMLLAGGQGTRLGVLTRDIAKPAVAFGGKYRIIDFPLSNCVNSGIDTVGVLTQYQPFELNQYIGNGQPWDLDRMNGGVFVLPPYMKVKNSEWYKGTANAIYQNIAFVKNYNPKYVVILSGDHIYKMDYGKMLEAHKAKGADCTIAVIDVPENEAQRFGIMKTDNDNKIVEFYEKPKKFISTKASMGIYIFNWDILKEYLIADEFDKNSTNDFGKDIIPAMLADNKNMYAYSFSGYWKDVGTIYSLWEANMDLLDEATGITLNDPDWKIYARNFAEPPHCVGNDAVVKNCIISEGSYIKGEVTNSIIFQKVKVGRGAKVINSVVFSGAVIEDGAIVKHSIIAANVIVEKDAKVGENLEKEEDITVIGEGAIIPSGAIVTRGSMIEGRVI